MALSILGLFPCPGQIFSINLKGAVLFYGWFKGDPGLCFRDLLISLPQTPLDAFDTLCVCGALFSSTEGILWVAANQVLGSVWQARQIPPRPAALKNNTTP